MLTHNHPTQSVSWLLEIWWCKEPRYQQLCHWPVSHETFLSQHKKGCILSSIFSLYVQCAHKCVFSYNTCCFAPNVRVHVCSQLSRGRKRDMSLRIHDAIITSLRQNDVAASFWRNNDVIITHSVRWDTKQPECDIFMIRPLFDSNLRYFHWNPFVEPPPGSHVILRSISINLPDWIIC